MKILKCAICLDGELDIINSDHSVNKKVKCRKCGFTNTSSYEKKIPEVVIIKKRNL